MFKCLLSVFSIAMPITTTIEKDLPILEQQIKKIYKQMENI